MPSNENSRLNGKQERDPRKDKAREKQEAAAKMLGKTNDWDRDALHGDGDTVGIEPDAK